MNLQPRPYSGLADLQKMKALISEGRKVYPHSRYPHIGDLDWWLYFGVFVGDKPFETSAVLWEDGAQIMAWGIFEEPNAYDLIVHPTLWDTPIEMEVHALMETRVEITLKDTDKPRGAIVWADAT